MIVDYKNTASAAATSHVALMPTHATGDLLVAFVGADAAPTIGTVAGWTSQQDASVAAVSIRMFTKVAASSSETFTIGFTGTEECTISMYSLRGVHGTTPVNTSAKRGTSDTSKPFDGVAVTTTEDDCLILTFCAFGEQAVLLHSTDDFVFMAQTDVGTLFSSVVSMKYQKTAGVCAAASWVAQGNTNGSLACTIAIRGDGTRKQIHQQADVNLGEMLEISWTAGINPNATSNTFPTSLSLATIGSVNTTYVGASNSTAAGITPSWSGCQIAIGTITAGNLGGHQCNFNAAKDLDNRLLVLAYRFTAPTGYNALPYTTDSNAAGLCFVLRDDTAYTAWSIGARGTSTTKAKGENYAVIQPDQATDTSFATSGSPVVTAIDGYLIMGQEPYADLIFQYAGVIALDTLAPCGGTSTNKITFDEFVDWANKAAYNQILAIREGSAVTLLGPVQWGGTEACFIDMARKTLQYRKSADEVSYLDFHVDEDRVGHEFYPNGYLDFTSTTFVTETPQYWRFHSSWDDMADGSWTGASVIGYNVTLRSTVTLPPMTFVNCPTFTQNSAVVNGVTFQGTKVLANAPGSIDNCFFTSAGTGHAIEISATGTVSMTGNTFTGYGSTGSTDAAIYNNSGGAVTINLGQGDTAPTYRNGAGASTTINAYVDTFTLNSSESSSLIQIFTTGTQTVLASGTGTQVTFNHSGNTVDYTVQKAGFVPQRVTAYLLAGSPTITVTLVADPAYVSGHGLILATDYNYNATTRVTTLADYEKGREVYSALIEDFISESAYLNKPFPIQAIGINRFDFLSDGTTAATIDAGDILFWQDAGMEWEHATTGNKTHKYCYISGTGTNASGTKGYYQHTDGSAPVALTLVDNNVAQVIQYYSDPNGDGSTADGYARTGHLVVKLFNDGYYQKSVNVLTAYDATTVESFEYIVDLQMVSTGLGTGTRGITIVVTDTTPAGTEYQTGYTFDYKIEGGASDSPSDLLRQWIYDVFTDPTASTYASKINFNWPDPIVESGGSYSTQYGFVYGQDTTTTYHGFYVEEGSGYHPDFLRQRSNDGSYFTTPTLAGVSVSALTAGWIQLYNVTQATEIESVATTSGYSKTWIDGTSADAGDTLRIRWRGYKKEAIEATFVATSNSIVALLDTPVEDAVVAAYETSLSTTGAAVAATGEFAMDSGNVQIDIDDPDNVFYWGRMVLWHSYAMAISSTGITYFWGAVDTPNVSNIVLNHSVVPVLIDNARVATVRSGDSVVVTTDDGVFPIANPTSGGGGVSFYFQGIGYTIETGVSGLTGDESTRLFETSTHTAAEAATAVLSAAQSTPIYADVRKVVGTTITGTGTEVDPWGP